MEISVYYYFLCLILWPLSLAADLFLKIWHLFWSDNSVRILNYHSISSDIRIRRMRYISVSPETFAAQMKFLADHNFNVIDLDDFLAWKQASHRIPPKTVILTFDDGFEDNYYNAFPVLSKYSYKAVLSVITKYIDGDTPFPWIKKYLSPERAGQLTGLPLKKHQLKAMSDNGITVASHTRHHISFGRLDKKRVSEEVFGSKKELEEILGKRVRYLAYPYGSRGDFDNLDKKIIQSAGYEAALSTKVGSNDLKSDLYELRRIPIFEIDGLSIFRRKVRGAYDFTALFQLLGFRIRKLIKGRI